MDSRQNNINMEIESSHVRVMYEPYAASRIRECLDDWRTDEAHQAGGACLRGLLLP